MSPDSFSSRWRVLGVLVAFVVLVAVAVAYVAYTNRSTTPTAPAPATHGTDTRPGGGADLDATDGTLAALEATRDPEEFAHLVAHALFTWDTTKAVGVEELVGRLAAVGDPLGESSPGLVADVTAYLPTAPMWLQLRGYSTRQWLTIDSVRVPDRWEQAETEAGADGLLPGTTAYTVRGTRHRAGVWEGEQVSSEHDVVFTVFMVCGPSYPQCHLLRLSRLDEPLD